MNKDPSHNLIGPSHRLDFSTLVRLALSELPGGGVIAGASSEWDSNQRFQRIQQALDEMTRQLRALEGAIPRPQIEPADLQILDEVVERAQREHSERKRIDYGRLLASSLIRNDVRSIRSGCSYGHETSLRKCTFAFSDGSGRNS